MTGAAPSQPRKGKRGVRAASALLFALAVGGGTAFRPGLEAKTPDATTPASAPAASSGSSQAIGKPLGSPSCSTTACHGSLTEDRKPTAIRGDEFHVWLDDPHSHAYAVLFEERSRHMMRNLGVADDNLVPRPGKEAEFQRYWDSCLACHGPGDAHSGKPSIARGPSLSEGVSCEGCHGNASQWIQVHYRPEWLKYTNEQKAKLGFLDTETPLSRARICTSCHVGDAGRDVNHDLIAAGHPGMKFDMSWYQTLIPSHWKENRTGAAKPETVPQPMRDWLVGQLVGASTALRQLERRAALSTQGKAPWPELSEYSCFACHHDLESDSWRQERGFWQPAADTNEFHYAKQGNTRVQLAWGNWTLESLGRMAEAFESDASKTFVTSFGVLSKTLSSGLQAKAETVQAEARTAAEDLDRWIESLQSTTDAEIRKTLRNVLAEKSGGETNTAWSVGTWDRAAILVLGLTAPYRSVPEKAPEPLRDVLQRIRFTNDAETVFDSPIHFRGPVGASEPEKASERERIRRLIEELVKADG